MVHLPLNRQLLRQLLSQCIRPLSLGVLLLACSAWGASALAQAVEAEGTAPITGPVGVAKRLAIQDAIRQALFQAKAQVSTTTVHTAKGIVADNVRFSARGSVTNVTVLDEWTDETNYYVRIRAQVPGATTPVVARQAAPAAAPQTSAAPAAMTSSAASATASSATPVAAPAEALLTADGDPAAAYRRKLAITQFHVLDRSQISDLPSIEVEFSRELKRRLDVDGRVRTVEASQYLVPLSGEDMVASQRILGAVTATQDSGQLAIEFAQSLGVQFVVSGLIRDMGITRHTLGPRVRHLELDVVVTDGVTGAEVARHRINESVEEGRLFDVATTTPVLNEKFYASPFGQRVNRMLDQLVAVLVTDVTGQPFTARVIRSEGNKVFFDAGGLANVEVGDVLSTYQLSPSSVSDPTAQRTLGFEETPSATLVVTQVQRLFSVGELDTETARMAPGDIIRFDP